MKRFAKFAGIAVFAAVAATGCAKKKPAVPAPAPPPPVVQQAPPPPPPTPAPQPPPPAPPAPRTLTEDEIFAGKSLEALNAEQPLGHVNFALDSSELDEAARGILDRNATWLRRWASTRVTIEGHADERGTPEYNLSLGDRRAAAVRDYLTSLGITADRLSAISKGEEQPFCRDQTESCWAQNRRGYFIITAK